MNWTKQKGWFRLSIIAVVGWLVGAFFYIALCENEIKYQGMAINTVKCFDPEKEKDLVDAMVILIGGAVLIFGGLNTTPWILRGFKSD